MKIPHFGEIKRQNRYSGYPQSPLSEYFQLSIRKSQPRAYFPPL